MNMCEKCGRMMSWTMLVLGLIFVLNSYQIFFNFRVSEWGIVLVVLGLCHLMGSNCPGCQKVMRRR